jgi:serine/threonine-protein phosphatase 2A regulatory subunit B
VSNNSSVRLFRVVDKKVIKTESVKKKIAKNEGLRLPRSKVTSVSKEGKLVNTFKTGMEHHLHSVSMCPDRENFLTAEQNVINLWNLERPGSEVYSLIDNNRSLRGLKPTVNDEYVTCAKFNTEGAMFLYATNTGHLRLCDLREASNFQRRPSMEFSLKPRKDGANVFDKWLNNISSASFVPGSHTVASRDYLSAKLWDMRMGGNSSMIVDSGKAAKPIYSAHVTDYAEQNLAHLM